MQLRPRTAAELIGGRVASLREEIPAVLAEELVNPVPFGELEQPCPDAVRVPRR